MVARPDEDISAFLKVLDPGDNVTGGGTASAVAGAMAAALVAMVARLSIGRKGMERDGYYRCIDSEATALSRDLLVGGRRDSQAFEALRASYGLPMETEEQRRLRETAIQDAVVRAARVPLANGESCRRVLDLCARLAGRSNRSATSDLACARHLAWAGALGCLANVEINLPSIRNQKAGDELAARARTLRADVQRDEDQR